MIKRFLVTGATGFFGRAFLHEVLRERTDLVSKVGAFARSESRLAELTTRYEDCPAYRPYLGDVRDYDRLLDACRGMDVVIHAAALKRVDDGSYNPGEMIATNIVGTQNVIRAATAVGVERVIVVSSDKAVAPINVYGATKFCAEQYATSYNAISAPRGTTVSVVRYGNVLASTGSVLGIWTRQRDAGIPLTLTAASMTRFVMTAKEAVTFVLTSVANSYDETLTVGGEIFVPRLQSARLTELADAIAPESHRTFIGKRVGGEKLAEQLLNEDEEWRAVHFMNSIIVPPAVSHWTTRKPTRAKLCKLCVEVPYASDNPRYLQHTPETLKNIVACALEEMVDV